jgi:methyl-accepting chemotaxis protein
MLIQILLLFFFLLILYQIFLAIFEDLREGLENAEYKEYDTKGPDGANILAQQNAGNIAYLKQRIDELVDLKATVKDATTNISQLQEQVSALVDNQTSAARSTPQVTTTGLDSK